MSIYSGDVDHALEPAQLARVFSEILTEAEIEEVVTAIADRASIARAEDAVRALIDRLQDLLLDELSTRRERARYTTPDFGVSE
jgi:hypothetical protein